MEGTCIPLRRQHRWGHSGLAGEIKCVVPSVGKSDCAGEERPSHRLGVNMSPPRLFIVYSTWRRRGQEAPRPLTSVDLNESAMQAHMYVRRALPAV